MSDLSVVVSSFARVARPAAESVLAAAARAGVDVELIVVGHGGRPEPLAGAAHVVEVLALGPAYARNRGLALASAAIVAFLDGELEVAPEWVEAVLTGLADDVPAEAVVGPIATRPQRPRHGVLPLWARSGVSNAAIRRTTLLELRGFDHVLDGERYGPSAADAEVFSRLRRRGDTIASSPKMVALAPAGRSRGTADALRALVPRRRHPRTDVAQALLRNLPEGVRGLLDATPEPFAQSHRAKTHFLYRAGLGRVLHLYANPSERTRRSVAERESIRARAPVGGIPHVYAVAETPDALWLLEELMPGQRPNAADPEAWFPAVADWIVGMAGPPGRPLAEVPSWNEHARELLDETPTELRRRVAGALSAVDRLGAAHMHGDLQRRNVLIDDGRVSVVDWEGAWLEGLPGLDLVFLTLFAAGEAPDTSIPERLARGEDVPWGGVRERLGSLGVDDAVLPDVLLTMLGSWALAENRRRARLGAPPAEPLFRPLFHRVAGAFVRDESRIGPATTLGRP
jgi:hypothetical protein